jgi:hypothetical protein
MIKTRILISIAVGLSAVALSACGDDGSAKPAPGTEGNPLTATQPGELSTPSASGSGADAAKQNAEVPSGEPSKANPTAPGYKALLDRQTAKPQHRFTPCNLVTEREAQAIVGKPMQVPVEALQGPTCIYRPRTGGALISVAVQATDFRALRPRIKGLHQVAVGDREAYCGLYGQPMLYMPVAAGRVLSINAQCDVARGFALKALPHL